MKLFAKQSSSGDGRVFRSGVWSAAIAAAVIVLAGQESAVLIDSKALEAAPLEVPGIAASTLGLLFVIVLPAALLAVGAVVVVLRRRK